MSYANCAACGAEVRSNHPADYAAVLYRDVRMSRSAGDRHGWREVGQRREQLPRRARATAANPPYSINDELVNIIGELAGVLPIKKIKSGEAKA